MIDDYPTLVFRVGEYEVGCGWEGPNVFKLNLKVIEGLDLVVQSMYKNELAIISIKVNKRSQDIGQSQLRTKQSLSISSKI